MTKQRILLVEDNFILAKVTEIQLKNSGFEVVEIVNSATTALKAASAHLPDLIIMDIQLDGEEDGIEIMNKVWKNHSIPVIYLTGNSDEYTRKKSENEQCVGYLVKPIDNDELIKAVNNAFS